MKSTKRIGILGHYGNRNLGDEAIIQAVIHNLRKRLPAVELIGFSINPEDTSNRHGVKAYPIRRRMMNSSTPMTTSIEGVSFYSDNSDIVYRKKRGLKEIVKKIPYLSGFARICFKVPAGVNALIKEIYFLFQSYVEVKTIDVLMVTGSNQFLDNFGGPWGFPYTLLKWTVLAKLAGAQVFFVSIGAGPLSEKLSFRFIRWALRFSEYVSLRDHSSQRMLHDLVGYRGSTQVVPDLAHSLFTDLVKPVSLPESKSFGRKSVVGINPMPLFDPRYWCDPISSKYLEYVSKITDFSERLIKNNYSVFFFPTQEKDNDVISDILDALDNLGLLSAPREEYVLPSNSVDELLANIAACDIIVPTRFHGTVLSLVMEKPMLGVCYYRKAKELLNIFGQTEFAYDHEEFSADDLWAGLEKLEAGYSEFRNEIIKKNHEFINLLNQQYLDIVNLIQ